MNPENKRPRSRRRRQARQIVRTLYVSALMAGLLVIPFVLLKQCIAPPKGRDMAASTPIPAATAPGTLDAPALQDDAIPDPDDDDADSERQVEMAAPITADTDRGPQRLNLPESRCHALHPSFQAKVTDDGLCEVWLHDLTRQDSAILLTASPRHGVEANARPVIALLPDTALP